MLGSWSTWLLISAELLVSTFATHGHAKFHHQAAAAKRQSQDESRGRWEELKQQYLTNLRNNMEPGGECTWDNMVVRREWGDMTREAKEDYISALHCLKRAPSQEDRDKYPGVRSRFDDFTIAHAINTYRAHQSPLLAVWHRRYIWAFEKALREECGYQHGQPYWLWPKYLGTDPNSWPLFDGTETSLSGNGTQTGEQCACVKSGPFKAWTVNLGPSPTGWGCSRNPRDDGYGYNRRCIERAFDVDQLAQLRYSDVVYTVQAPDVNTFANVLELDAPAVHNTPHLFVGGLQIEVTFASQDPWFFQHHTMVEFVFSMWQSIDFDVRTSSLANIAVFEEARKERRFTPIQRQPTLGSTLYLSDIFANVTVRDAMWPNRGEHCWRYE